MDPTPAQHRTAALATEWAAEVAPCIRAIVPNPAGETLQRFAHHLRDEDPTNQLTMMFYFAIEETRAQTLPWQPGATEAEEGEPRYLVGLIKRLILNTQTVAAPFFMQRRFIPEDFVCLADEVASDFGWCLGWFLPKSGFVHGLLMDRQLAALVRVNDWLGSFSGPSKAELWTDEALQHAPQWSRARELAKEALTHFAIDMP